MECVVSSVSVCDFTHSLTALWGCTEEQECFELNGIKKEMSTTGKLTHWYTADMFTVYHMHTNILLNDTKYTVQL